MERTVIDRAEARRLYRRLRRYVAVDDEYAPPWTVSMAPHVARVNGRYRAMRWAAYIPPEDRLIWRRPSFEEFVQLYGLEIRAEAA